MDSKIVFFFRKLVLKYFSQTVPLTITVFTAPVQYTPAFKPGLKLAYVDNIWALYTSRISLL